MKMTNRIIIVLLPLMLLAVPVRVNAAEPGGGGSAPDSISAIDYVPENPEPEEALPEEKDAEAEDAAGTPAEAEEEAVVAEEEAGVTHAEAVEEAVATPEKAEPVLPAAAAQVLTEKPALANEKKNGPNGFVKGPQGWGIYKDGEIDTSVTDVVKNEHGWWYVDKGRVNFNYNGVARNKNGLWCIKDSKVDFDMDGLLKAGDNGWYRFLGGRVDEGYTGLQKNDNGWWYVDKGRVHFNHEGLVKNEYGWWYVKNSNVSFGHNGIATNEYGTWFIRNSKVDFGVNGVVKAGNGNWYSFSGGKVTPGPTVRKNENGWWYIDKTGRVDFGYNGLAKNEHGWWYLQNGKVTFAYNGLQRNENGLWYIRNSKVDFGADGVVKAADGVWYCFSGGKLQENYKGIAKNENGWWYIVNGRVDFSHSVPGNTGKVTINDVLYTYTSGGFSFERPAKAVVNVSVFGAVPGDGKDDTAAIRNAINSLGTGAYANVKTLYIPAGTYNIDAVSGGIKITRNDVDIIMEPGTVLEAAPTSSDSYSVFYLDGASNVKIFGGVILGERNRHTGTNGVSGIGILAYRAKNVSVANMTIRDCWGDGIALGAGFNQVNGKWTAENCNNVKVLDCMVNNNRRNNFSITGADNVTIDGCTIYDANGSPNQCGILIEPFVIKNDSFNINTYMPCKNITVSNSKINAYQNRKATQEPGRQFFTFATYLIDSATQNMINRSDNKINYSADNVTISKCVINGDLANYSGRNMKVWDSTINGTLEYLFGVDVRNTKYGALRKL